MIGLLRFVGLINAAVWFGSALFIAIGAESAATSPAMKDLLGPKNFPYFSLAIDQILTTRLFHVYLLCSVVALLHLAAEWLYLGKYPHRVWLGLVLCFCLIGVTQNYWLQPRLAAWHRLRYSGGAQSQAADHAFGYGQTASEMLDFIVILGLAVYLWRVAYPPEPARFLTPSKFRG